jgi:hypothetical protein
VSVIVDSFNLCRNVIEIHCPSEWLAASATQAAFDSGSKADAGPSVGSSTKTNEPNEDAETDAAPIGSSTV